VDTDWNRSFLGFKAVEGQILDHTWGSLSAEVRLQIASEIAQFCGVLASSRSEITGEVIDVEVVNDTGQFNAEGVDIFQDFDCLLK
jgi:hypothetical protein